MKYWSKEFVKYVINDAVRLDAINWSNITRGNVCVFRDKRYSQLAPEYILLTEKDRIRLKKFYPKLPENFEIIELAEGHNVFGGVLTSLGGDYPSAPVAQLWVYTTDLKAKHIDSLTTAHDKLKMEKAKQNGI